VILRARTDNLQSRNVCSTTDTAFRVVTASQKLRHSSFDDSADTFLLVLPGRWAPVHYARFANLLARVLSPFLSKTLYGLAVQRFRFELETRNSCR
jgi:hypothetical protein